MISEEINNINENYIILCDPIKNSIIQHSYFYKLIYSNDTCSMNGLFILFNIKNITIFKEKFTFDKLENISTIQKIVNIEEHLISLLNSNKKKNYKISELITNCNIKYNLSEYTNNKIINNTKFADKLVILKISGIWETKESIGLTFKFLLVDRILDFNNLPIC